MVLTSSDKGVGEPSGECLSTVAAAATSGTRLDRDPAIAEHLSETEIAELLDPAHYLGHATDLVDRALAERPTGGSR